MQNIILRFEEELVQINSKLKEYEAKTYNIFSSSIMMNDRIEYDRLVGQKRFLELSINIVNNEIKQQEIDLLKAKVECLESNK